MMLLLAAVLMIPRALAKKQTPLQGNQELSVPGSNPFFYCYNPDPFTLQIAYINLTPPNPVDWIPGHNITIEIDGHNQQIIEEGSIVDISIMKRDMDGVWRPLISRRRDLCLGLEAAFGEACPVRSGVSTEIRNLTLPPETPRDSAVERQKNPLVNLAQISSGDLYKQAKCWRY